jgi:hypothetical protein
VKFALHIYRCSEVRSAYLLRIFRLLSKISIKEYTQLRTYVRTTTKCRNYVSGPDPAEDLIGSAIQLNDADATRT